ncbi:Terpene synthase 5 [Euphorbia peplus]|nr:Terpene synthase 5 [Euphorbia peplus]
MEDIDLRGCLKNIPHSMWSETFIPLAPHHSEFQLHSKQLEALKLKVNNMLVDSTREVTYNIEFIILLCRLGVSYHFEDEINKQVSHIFVMLPQLLEDNDYDLYTSANLFRVLRQHGYNTSCDVFKKFKNEDGEFKEDIANDVKSILCLYEACFLAIPGEDILDDALAFTKKHLNNLVQTSSSCFQKHIKNALMYPSHRTIERLDTLHYISFYEECGYANETLLKFAKSDYNGLQLLYKKELALISSWWKNVKVAENLPYARDRIVESYVWMVGSIFEPQYSNSRILLGKYGAVITWLDDTYDSYGTIDELRLLTAALQRFTIDAVDELPESFKPLYRVIFELMKNDDSQEFSCKTNYVKEMMQKLAMCYDVEAVWRIKRIAPSFYEYIENGKVTGTFEVFASLFILGEKSMGMNEILWVRNDPEIVVGTKLYFRLTNDISGARADETERGDFPKGVDCYMIQNGVSQDQAIDAIVKILDDRWKETNEYLLKPTTVPKILLKFTLNSARTCLVYYRGTDLYTYGHNMKPLITSLFINPLSMDYALD